MRLVERDHLRRIEVKEIKLAGRLDYHLWSARSGQLDHCHDRAGIATDAGSRYILPMPLTLNDLFSSPDHYLHSVDGTDAIFVPMDRAAYHRSIFLDGRVSPARPGSMRMPLAQLAGGQARAGEKTSWIFHVAHCGSTLLARALDHVATNLVLREPLALRQVAVSADRERLPIILRMLGKRYRPDAPTLVKANVPVNFLLPVLAEVDCEAPAVFLYSGLRDYLLAILRSEEHRDWLRRVTTQLRAYMTDISSRNDAELAATLWLAQIRLFAAALERMPNGRTLEAEALFNEPLRVVAQAARHLRIHLDPKAIDEAVAGPLFTTYSKNPSIAFDNDARLRRRAELEDRLAAELVRGQAFVSRTTGRMDPFADALHAARLIRD